MNRFQEKQLIQIDEEQQIIKFTRKRELIECDHKNIQVSEVESEVRCIDCNTKLNPVLWIAKYLRQLNQVTERNNRMLAEVRLSQSLKRKTSLCVKAVMRLMKLILKNYLLKQLLHVECR